MRKFLRVVLPPVVSFLIYAGLVRYHDFYTDRLHDTDNSVVETLMTYFRYVSPLFFVVALITQVLIVIPVWRNVIVKSWAANLIAFIILLLICGGISFGISYMIWDRNAGSAWLKHTTLIMTGIQLSYWLIDILILLGLHKTKAEVEKKDEEE